MENTFRRFMKQNVAPHENTFYEISKRFCEEDGTPIKFEFRALTSKDVDESRDSAITKTRRGITGVNSTILMHNLITKALVFPDLEDKELQDSYGVYGASALIGVMFDAKEYTTLSDIVGALAGFDQDTDELKAEAKN